MNKLTPNVYDTVTSELTTVVTGLPNYDASTIYEDPICHHLGEGNEINPAALKDEFKNFDKALGSIKATVLKPDLIKGLEEQMFPRDLFFVIGDICFMSKMKFQSRELEKPALDKILSSMNPQKIIAAPANPAVVIEGGDIRVVGGDTVYIGWNDHPTQGRTNLAGVAWLLGKMKETGLDQTFKLEPLYLNQPAPGEGEVLHLDCAFGPFSDNEALIHPAAFKPEDLKILSQKYANLVALNKAEQHQLISNILVSGKTVFGQSGEIAQRVNQLMRKSGLTVLEIPCEQRIIAGGTNHCSSADLIRN